MEPANGDGPPFELNSYQEAEFHLSIYHYFLWKAAQEKSKGSARPHAENGGGPTADATPSPNVIVGLSDHDEKQNNDSALENNGNGQKYGALTDGESNDGPDADSTAQKPSARVDNGGSAASSSQNFQQVADAILQQFPQHVDFFTPTFGSMDAAAQLSLPPVVTTLYKEFPRLQTELAAAQTRMGQLESVLLTKHYETVTLNNEVARLKLQISFGPGLPPTPIAPQNNKRKDPPVVSVDGGRRPKVDAATLAAGALIAYET